MPATNSPWRDFFMTWPANVPRAGIVVSTLNEQTPFKNFWIRGETLLLERNVPDALGGRFIVIGFDVINTFKFTSPLNAATIADAGFEERPKG
ncbi:MAG: hypothetical protein KF688_10020 [Pirellulales bacterium]|nr:hypothetical protein [Pirellulales bacterium]